MTEIENETVAEARIVTAIAPETAPEIVVMPPPRLRAEEKQAGDIPESKIIP